MENLLSRYRNVTILVAVLFAQVLGLAVQVRRSPDQTSGRLIRVWAVTAITPFEKAIVWVQYGFSRHVAKLPLPARSKAGKPRSER